MKTKLINALIDALVWLLTPVVLGLIRVVEWLRYFR